MEITIGSESQYAQFYQLMRHRIENILMVSSLYESFNLFQDGQLTDQLVSQFADLNLSQTPSITHVSDGQEALDLLKQSQPFDLIITTIYIGDLPVNDFARQVKSFNQNTPIILLAFERYEIKTMEEQNKLSAFDNIFLWHGDFKVLLGIVKYIEDRANIDDDTRNMGVQVIILVEDNIIFYSLYLSLLYSELLKYSQHLIADGLNVAHKIARMRARPKIIFCKNYEEASHAFVKYQKFLLGVITDIKFNKDGVLNDNAGVLFAKKIRQYYPDMPILLQSFSKEIVKKATEINASFVRKDSPTLMHDLKKFIREDLAFGDFIFRLQDGTIIDKARDLNSLEEKIKIIPDESYLYHAEHNHFSKWLKAQTEFSLAERIRSNHLSKKQSVQEFRENFIDILEDFRKQQNLEIISEFSIEHYNKYTGFARMGGGSLGGKGRGIAFIHSLIQRSNINQKIKHVNISTPKTVVLCTNVFYTFIKENDLLDFAINTDDDDIINQRFQEALFPQQYYDELSHLLSVIKCPLAIRSSSLLEDSQYQSFAGIYETYMFPNCHQDHKVRLQQLLIIIKRIFASVYFQQTKRYMMSTSYRLEEEQMAIVIQEIIGKQHQSSFYPEISGVARSYNYYAAEPVKPEDGVTSVALGFGKTIVEGGKCFMFCHKYPQRPTIFQTTNDYLQYSQREFFALQVDEEIGIEQIINGLDLTKQDLSVAEKDQSLDLVGSVFSPENNNMSDGLSSKGIRLITFNLILKYNTFPLAELVNRVLKLGEIGMCRPIEIEFAINFSKDDKVPHTFSVLQIRPMVLDQEEAVLDFDEDTFQDQTIICKSSKVLGSGLNNKIYDIVTIDPAVFNRAHTQEIAQEVEYFNNILMQEKAPYILIGAGRWGSSDPWLGIPVSWDQICGAQVIIETGFDDINIQPSQGSHFFHNIISSMVGYFTINNLEDEILNWSWIQSQPIIKHLKHTMHLRLKKPMTVKMNGRKNNGIIYQ